MKLLTDNWQIKLMFLGIMLVVFAFGLLVYIPIHIKNELREYDAKVAVYEAELKQCVPERIINNDCAGKYINGEFNFDGWKACWNKRIAYHEKWFNDFDNENLPSDKCFAEKTAKFNESLK